MPLNGNVFARAKIQPMMPEIKLSADELVLALLDISRREPLCLLDSCGVGHLGSHLLIAGIRPVEGVEFSHDDAGETLALLNEKLSGDLPAIFTISYDLGLKMLGREPKPGLEPDVFVATFENLIIHDYSTGVTNITGKNADEITDRVLEAGRTRPEIRSFRPTVDSNFTREEYLGAIEVIRERIRDGDTYQTNLTQKITARFDEPVDAQNVFYRLRRDHPAPFAAFIERSDSTVVSASPERFIRIEGRRITTSPIKGTRPRSNNPKEDDALRAELLASEKDRAENTMIVDLLRNDLGRVCEYGSVRVEKLCDLEEHPTLFHLVSTVSGKLRENASITDILTSLFPCGSITGAPKISTMGIIDEIEPDARGLSMGAIGFRVPPGVFGDDEVVDLSVAIRTMVVRGNEATFNVGGAIVIDSDPAKEYDESLLKSSALLAALGSSPDDLAR